ncbi:MAG: HPr family phosphocarrier protein [Deltaproteobacteria bacterium]|nr:HPr family phosphocarrier protein [Deltaproteobacteria bacterium]MCB9788330.1 HPr family phosphocarrier protein [Deltaproteobacteria bacterium]
MTTLESTVRIGNSKGLHVRAATMLAREAVRFASNVTLEHRGVQANGKSVMNLLLLTAAHGAEVRVVVTGDDADEALAAVVRVIESGFGE